MKNNNGFIKKLRSKGYSQKEILKIMYSVSLLFHDRLNEELSETLSKKEFTQYSDLENAEKKSEYLEDIYKNKTGHSITDLINDILDDIEKQILTLDNSLANKLQ